MISRYSSFSKQKARVETIGQFVPKLIGTPLQYWTISSRCATKHGKVLRGSEFDYVTSAGIATPDQWHGVDRLPKVVERNTTVQTMTPARLWKIL